MNQLKKKSFRLAQISATKEKKHNNLKMGKDSTWEY